MYAVYLDVCMVCVCVYILWVLCASVEVYDVYVQMCICVYVWCCVVQVLSQAFVYTYV